MHFITLKKVSVGSLREKIAGPQLLRNSIGKLERMKPTILAHEKMEIYERYKIDWLMHSYAVLALKQ